MIDIVEQSEQKPRNATPLGWDDNCFRWPSHWRGLYQLPVAA